MAGSSPAMTDERVGSSRRGHQQHAAAFGAADRVVLAGAGKVIVARLEHQIVEREIARKHVGFFVVLVFMRRKRRACLRPDQAA